MFDNCIIDIKYDSELFSLVHNKDNCFQILYVRRYVHMSYFAFAGAAYVPENSSIIISCIQLLKGLYSLMHPSKIEFFTFVINCEFDISGKCFFIQSIICTYSCHILYRYCHTVVYTTPNQLFVTISKISNFTYRAQTCCIRDTISTNYS